MIMHCMLNSFSVIISYITFSKYESINTNITVDAQTLGLYLGAFFLAPIIFVTGKMILLPETHKKKHFAIAGIISAVMLIGGITLMAVFSTPPIFSANGPLNMEEGEVKSFGTIGIEEEKDYTVMLVVTGSSANFRVEVSDENGELICGGDVDASQMEIYTSTVLIHEGKITINLISLDGDPGDKAQYTLVVK